MQDRRVLVTGGAGYIGSHLVDALDEVGYEVHVLDDLSTGRLENLATRLSTGAVHFVEGSILDSDLVDHEVQRSDAVYHLAAAVGVSRIIADPLSAMHTNVAGTESVLAACARHGRRVLIASSSEVYGRGAGVPMAEDDDCVLGPTSVPRWSYAAAKTVDEHLAFAYASEGLPVVAVRYFNSYGPRVDEPHGASVVGAFVRAAVAGEPLLVDGDGSQRRCFTFVDDTVRATVLAGTTPRAVGRVYNVGATTETSILELAETIIAATASPSTIVYVPARAAHGEHFEDVSRRVPDITRARDELGWEPRVSLPEGLRRTIAWWREAHAHAA